MELEKQVTSLELSKKLKELGVKQESLFYWDNHEGFGEGFILSREPEMEEVYSAFTVAELGWIIDYKAGKGREEYDLPVVRNEENLANAMAKMLIYLIENKLMKIGRGDIHG